VRMFHAILKIFAYKKKLIEDKEEEEAEATEKEEENKNSCR